MTTEPTVIRPDQRIAPEALQTPAIHREQAFVEGDRWVGWIKTTPGEWSGWHHHAANDTYFYILRGAIEIESANGSSLEIRAGDFALVPNNVIHRERTPGESAEAVVLRLGSGPTVVNVDGPAGWR
jgi:mannose-6-phosphate isomerase-like protein (cupin superfamily)